MEVISATAKAMSLALIQGYSSAEEEEDEVVDNDLDSENSDDGERDDDDQPLAAVKVNLSVRDKSFFELPQPSVNPDLPSAFDAFSEVSGPPQFLNNSVEDNGSGKGVDQPRGRHHGGKRNRKEKKDLPSGAVMKAKAQLVGIHDRVRSDVEGNQPPSSSAPNTTTLGAKRVATATNPNAEDAADLLRMCLQCGVPKTFSNARGMFCPLCGDRPFPDPSDEPKKKGSMIKDKEKSKRMRGQSSHATWKSETEMQLRQHFD